MNETTSHLRIVAGIDFSAASIEAARCASKWLAHDGDLILAHALVLPEASGIVATRYRIAETLLTNARVGAQRRLDDVTSAFNLSGIKTDIRVGRPAEVLAEVARAHEADLIVVGKHGEGRMLRGYTGRTADSILRSAAAPILVMNGRMEERPRTILVPITYSSVTPFVVEWARKLHEASGAKVVALHVVGAAVLSHVLSMSAVKPGETPTLEEIDEIFREDADRWRNEFVAAGIPGQFVDSKVVFGEVSTAVLAAAAMHQADLIVMGSHAAPLRRILLGSAATAVLRDAEVPVLIVVESDKIDRIDNIRLDTDFNEVVPQLIVQPA